MDAQAYLNQVKLYDTHINNKLEELADLKDLITKITATWKDDVVGGSSSQDRLGDTVAKIIDLEGEINQAIDEYIDKKRQITATIEKVEKPEQLELLHKRYIEYKSLEEIACDMNYSYRNVCYIHGDALQSIRAILKEKT